MRDHLLGRESRVNKNGEIVQRFRLVSLDDKISVWTRIITGFTFDKSDTVWQGFVKAKTFPNTLVYYRPTSSTVYNDGTVAMAKEAIDSAHAVIERFYSYFGQPPPPYLATITT